MPTVERGGEGDVSGQAKTLPPYKKNDRFKIERSVSGADVKKVGVGGGTLRAQGGEGNSVGEKVKLYLPAKKKGDGRNRGTTSVGCRGS